MKNKLNIKKNTITLLAISTILLLIFIPLHTKKLIKYQGITNATYESAEIYSSSSDSTTYTLTYSYKVNNKQYSYTTNYGTGIIPKGKETRKIKYNPNNPSDAYLEGLTITELGVGIGIILILSALTTITKKEKLQSILFGIIILIVASMTLNLISGHKNIFYIFKGFKEYGWVTIVPSFFVLLSIIIFLSPFLKISVEEKTKINNTIKEINNITETPTFHSSLNFIFKSSNILTGIFSIIVLIFALYLLINVSINTINESIFIFLFLLLMFIIPIFLILINLFINLIKNFLKPETIEKNTKKFDDINNKLTNAAILSFFSAWFIFLIYFDYIAIKNHIISLFIFSIILWAFGIFFIYKKFKQQKK